jgi:hypothetical protein
MSEKVKVARKPIYLNTRSLTSHLCESYLGCLALSSTDLDTVFGPYIFFPLISSLTWLGGLLALIAIWARDGKPRYQDDEASVVFISDVGAAHHVSWLSLTECQC